MTIRTKFIYEEDRETGIIGFRPLHIKGGESTTGVAHDILEHFPDARLPGIEGELMALGAMLALRIENGLTSVYFKSEEELALLMMQVIEWQLSNGRKIKTLPSRPLHSDFEWAEGVIQAAAHRLHGLILSEYRDSSFIEEMPSKEDLAASVIPWLRKGYRGARRRFAEFDLYTLGKSVFDSIEKFSRRLADSDYLVEGTEVTFLVNPRTGLVDAKAHGELVSDWL